MIKDNVVQQINHLPDELSTNQDGVVDASVGLDYINTLYNNEFEWVICDTCDGGEIYDRTQGTFTRPPHSLPIEPNYEVS